MPLPPDMFLASLRYKFIYIIIPKAASTSIKSWMMKLENKTISYIHDDCRKHFQLNKLKLPQSEIKEFFTFTFVRNPYERLASSFINKFVHFTKPRLTNAVGLVNKIRRHRHIDKGISFEEFVEHIRGCNEQNMDVHWRPQYLFAKEKITPDFIGKMENIEEDFKIVQDKIGVAISLPKENQNVPKQCDRYLGDILSSALKTIPYWEELYNSKLYNEVTNIYKDDFKAFGYQTYEDINRA